jgi:hypothetical protein
VPPTLGAVSGCAICAVGRAEGTSDLRAIFKAVDDLAAPGTWLAHYTRAETAFSRILPKGRLLMNPYAKMRDPFENKKPMFRSASMTSATPDSKEAHLELFWKVQREVSKSRDLQRLLSFTQDDPREGGPGEKPFRCAWARPRMWEQYAENHRGVCLLFDRDELIETLRQELGRDGQYLDGAVTYTVGGFGTSAAAMINLDGFDEETLEDDVGRHVVRHSRDFFFLKTEDWATEFEYRFLFRAADYNPLQYLKLVSFRNALRYVVVGEAFPSWQIASARVVAEEAGVELRFMTWELGRPYPAKQPAK